MKKQIMLLVDNIRNTKKTLTYHSFSNNLPKARMYLFVVLLLIAIVYFLTLSVNHNEAEDSLHYLYSISYGSLSDQFHPNHLLYNFTNYAFLHLWQSFGYEGDAELTVKLANIVAALSALLILYLIAANLNIPLMLTYLCIISVAFSYGFWWYTVECETYILPIAFVLLCLHRLILIRKNFHKVTNHLLLGVFNAIAVLFHKQHILLSGIILFAYILIFFENRKKIIWPKLMAMMTIYIALCGFIVLPTYLLVAILIKDLSTFDHIFSWILNLEALHLDSISGDLGWTLSDLPKAVIGLGRTFVGGHYIFSFSIFSDLLTKMMPNYSFTEEIFLIKDFSIIKSCIMTLLSLSVFCLTLYIFFQIYRNFLLRLIASCGSDLSGLRFCIIILLVHFVTYFLFNMAIQSQNIEMWISLVPIAILILGLLTAPIFHKTSIKISIVLILVCLFFTNLYGSVLPQTDADHDYWYNFNSWLINNCKRKDLLVCGSGYISDGYVMYYSGAKVFSTLGLGQELEKEFQDVVTSQDFENVYFSSTIYQPIKKMSTRYHYDNSQAEAFFSKSSDNLTLVHSDSYQKIFLYRMNEK